MRSLPAISLPTEKVRYSNWDFLWPAFGDFPHNISKGIDDDAVGDEDEAEMVKPILARPVFRLIFILHHRGCTVPRVNL